MLHCMKSLFIREVATKDAPGRKYVLAIDGGGFRSYACLVLLHHLMRQLPKSASDPVPLPCQIFDLISGTSTGGLIAILLGRLGLDCLTAMSVYKELGADLFGKFDAKKTQGKAVSEPSRTFEEKLAAVVEKYTGMNGASMKNGTLDTIDHILTDVSNDLCHNMPLINPELVGFRHDCRFYGRCGQRRALSPTLVRNATKRD